MNYIQRIETWGNTHHPKGLDFLRIALGLFLCFKAISFLMNMSELVGLISNSASGSGNLLLVLAGQFIVLVTLFSGILLVLGLHTRLVCLVQIPILAGAIFLIRNAGGQGENIWITVLTLVLLIVFAVLGNGPLSFDKMVREKPDNRPHT